MSTQNRRANTLISRLWIEAIGSYATADNSLNHMGNQPMVTHSAIQSAVLQNVHILVVDNHRDTRDLYSFLLEDYGVKVTALSTVKEALAFLDLCRPTLIISEIRFDQESIYPLILRAKAPALNRSRKLPVIITSTCSTASLMEQMSIPIDVYLIKPIDVDHLVGAVWRMISQIRASQPMHHQPQRLLLSHCIESSPHVLSPVAGQ